MIGLAIIAACCVVAYLIGCIDVAADVDREMRYHQHDYQRVGYGGAGWSVYECACGAKEIDA